MNREIKYGRIILEEENFTSLGKFIANKRIDVVWTLHYLFQFQLFKQIKRGDTIVRANPCGYAFANPLNGTINLVKHGESSLPTPHDFENPNMRECIRLSQDNALEDTPSFPKVQPPEIPKLISVDKVKKDVINFITRNLIVSKSYTVHSRGYNSGFREATFIFKKKDFADFRFLGCIAVPTFHLIYKHPDSPKEYKRDVLGYSGEVILNEIKCFKTKMFGKECENFPDNVCPECENLFCEEHGKRCETCGKFLCENCITSKGILRKHYYCPKCFG